jgi:hypothetical protein
VLLLLALLLLLLLRRSRRAQHVAAAGAAAVVKDADAGATFSLANPLHEGKGGSVAPAALPAAAASVTLAAVATDCADAFSVSNPLHDGKGRGAGAAQSPATAPGATEPAGAASILSTPLPPGWVEKTSRSTGRVYYYNSSTGETTFVRPAGMVGAVQAAAALSSVAVSAGGAASTLPPLRDGFVEKKSRSTGAAYYVNSKTGATTLKRPI